MNTRYFYHYTATTNDVAGRSRLKNDDQFAAATELCKAVAGRSRLKNDDQFATATELCKAATNGRR